MEEKRMLRYPVKTVVQKEKNMPGLDKEEAKKDLEGLLEQGKSSIQKQQESLLTPEQKKAQEEKKVQDAKDAETKRLEVEKQAKLDAELLSKKDEEIKDEAEKKRKTELLEKRAKEEDAKLSAEERIEKIKAATQKRIDELSNKLKETQDKSSKEAQVLRQELETLRKEKEAPREEDVLTLVEREESERVRKYLDEDKSLPLDRRREMPDEEIDEWLLTDQKAAIAWIQRREFRREIEKRQNLLLKQQEGVSKKLFERQTQSYMRVLEKHPELNIVARKKELMDGGMSEDEAISEIRKDNKKLHIMLDYSEKHPELKTNPQAPELAMKEMEKLLEGKNENSSEVDELRKQVETLSAEIARLSSTDEGIGSTLQRKKEADKSLTEAENAMVETMRANKATQVMIDSALKKFREKKK
jgi:hypothetical protein